MCRGTYSRTNLTLVNVSSAVPMSDSNKVRLHLDKSLYGEIQDPFLQDEDSVAIAELLPQILRERQSFLNITEESLQEEIIQKNKGIESFEMPESVSTEDVTEDAESNFQKFQKQKLELLGHINSAMNETSLSLDFVSLLMSASKPNVSKATMSPYLTKHVPLGSLSADRISRSSYDTEQSKDERKSQKAESIGLGWKYQSLNHISELFKGAGTQLRTQVDIERQYWGTVHNVLDHGEVLFSLRDPLTNSRAIGVKYGYGDSGSSYLDKGLAVLRKDEQTGDVSFGPMTSGHHQITQESNKFTRVKVLSKIDNDFMLTGQSIFEKDSIEEKSEHKVINDIEKARYFLFESDLFYHLIREAKNLINYNVSIISNKIVIELFHQIIEIESVVYDENNEEELDNIYQNINEESSKNNEKAQAILTFLKLMLCCYYNYNLELKQKIPTSFTKWKQSNSHPLMLRPLIGNIRHEHNLHSMKKIIDRICQGLDSSLFSHGVEEEKYLNLKAEKLTNAFKKAVTKPISTFKLIIQKLSTQEHLNVEVEVTTSEIFVNLVLVLTVSKYRTIEELKLNQHGTNVLQLKFSDFNEIEESMNWTILNFLA